MKRAGFTIIELLVTIVIFTLILVTVYSTFYMGMKAWRRGGDKRELQKIRLGLLKIDKELKDSFFFSKLSFKGTDKEVTFPLSISSPDSEVIYTVSYIIDTDEQTGLYNLIRKEKAYAEEAGEGRVRRVFTLMKSIRFKYGYEASSGYEDFEWQGSWDGTSQNKLPSGVKIFLETADGQERFSRVFFLQHGALGAQ